MADDKIKIQPASEADVAAGPTSVPEATEQLPDITDEQFAGMNDSEKLALMGNVKKFRAEATQKSQEAAEIRRQNEQLQAEREYFKTEAQKKQELVDKYSEFLTRGQQPEKSTPSQPPEYDEYNPKQSYTAFQKYHDERLNQSNSQYGELKKEFESLREETNVGLRTMKMEQYLKEAIPTLGKDVDGDEILFWFNIHPEVDRSFDNINRAIRERQTKIDTKVKIKTEEYLKQKEEDAKNAQEVPGAPYAGSKPDFDKFVNMTPAERDAEVAKSINKSLGALGGGGR